MRITLFGVAEANELLTEVRPRLERLQAQKLEFERVEARHSLLEVVTSGADPANPDATELRGLAESRRALGESLHAGLAELADLGVIVKDLDTGLCDFYSLMGDRLVYLCWRLGEPEVAHWHSLDGGFAGRRLLRKAERE